MKGGAGFTIVETLIVLAVTMFMFASAVLLINGRQRSTAFNQAIRAVQNQLEQTMSDVGSGYYESDGTIVCQKGVDGGIQLSTGSDNTQGTNKDCLFMGKALQFGVLNTDPERYSVFTVVGLRTASDPETGTFNLQNAKARVIARTTTDSGSTPNAFSTPILQYGLTLKSMYYDSPSNTIGAIGFLSNVSNLGESDGARRVDVVAFRGTSMHDTTQGSAAAINDSISNGSAVVAPANGVFMCFSSGGTDQSGLISIGANGQQGAVTLKIFNNRTCS